MSAVGNPTSVDERWDVVHKVAGSAAFQRSPRLRGLLIYICERSIQNRPEELREQQIGCGVFGRKPDYNPGEDNIVRVEMRQLRKRLEEYFATEGKAEPYAIVVPKGSYVPVFEPREQAAPAVASPPLLDPGRARSSGLMWLLALIALAGIVTSVWLWTARRTLEKSLASTASPKIERSPVWPLLFNSGQETLIVCADSSLVMAQALLHRSVTLEEYLKHDFDPLAARMPSDVKEVLRSMPNWQFTDVTDVRLVQRLYRLNSDQWDKVSVRTAKTTQTQDFKTGNAVLLGSIRSNLWNVLFEPMLNFRFEYDEPNHSAFIRNRNPRPGEQAIYRAARPGQSGDSYSLIALVPNLRRTGYVLIIAGTTAEGTESAGEFIMNAASSATLINTLAAQNKGHIPYFEVLLRSGTLAGIAKNAEVVAQRVIDPDAAQR